MAYDGNPNEPTQDEEAYYAESRSIAQEAIDEARATEEIDYPVCPVCGDRHRNPTDFDRCEYNEMLRQDLEAEQEDFWKDEDRAIHREMKDEAEIEAIFQYKKTLEYWTETQLVEPLHDLLNEFRHMYENILPVDRYEEIQNMLNTLMNNIERLPDESIGHLLEKGGFE